MTHFMALNGHGKLSVLGRVSAAAAPAYHASTKGEGKIFPPGINRQVAQNISLKTCPHTSTVASRPVITENKLLTAGIYGSIWKFSSKIIT